MLLPSTSSVSRRTVTDPTYSQTTSAVTTNRRPAGSCPCASRSRSVEASSHVWYRSPGPDHPLFESVYHLLFGHDVPAYAVSSLIEFRKQDEKMGQSRSGQWAGAAGPSAAQWGVKSARFVRPLTTTRALLESLQMYRQWQLYIHYVLQNPGVVDVPIQLVVPSQLSLQTHPAQTFRHAPVHKRSPVNARTVVTAIRCRFDSQETVKGPRNVDGKRCAGPSTTGP